MLHNSLVHEARFITPMFTEESRPYVSLLCGDQRYETRPVQANVQLLWDEEFLFDVEQEGREMLITVIDSSRAMPRDVLGKAFITVEKQNMIKWYALGLKGQRSGEIKIETIYEGDYKQISPRDPKPTKLTPKRKASFALNHHAPYFANQMSPRKNGHQPTELEQMYSQLPKASSLTFARNQRKTIESIGVDRLIIHVVEARELLAKDSDGYSDPFATITIGNTSRTTSTKNKTLDPKWNESFFFQDVKPNSNLHVVVSDRDLIGRDKIGQLVIPVVKICDQDEGWFQLTDPERGIESCGSIFLRFQLS